MLKIVDMFTSNSKGIGIFLGGVLFGTAGIRILKSDDARKVYVQGTAAALRGKEEVMETATVLRENCEDIYEEAKEVNEKRAAEKGQEKEIIEDKSAAKAKA